MAGRFVSVITKICVLRKNPFLSDMWHHALGTLATLASTFKKFLSAKLDCTWCTWWSERMHFCTFHSLVMQFMLCTETWQTITRPQTAPLRIHFGGWKKPPWWFFRGQRIIPDWLRHLKKTRERRRSIGDRDVEEGAKAARWTCNRTAQPITFSSMSSVGKQEIEMNNKTLYRLQSHIRIQSYPQPKLNKSISYWL